MKKEEIFNNLIFESFKDKRHYEQIKHGMNRARSMMMKHTVFEKASAIAQYSMCMTIYIIATQSSTKALHNLKIINKPEEEIFEYAIDEYFEGPKIIESKEIKLLNETNI